MIVDASAPARRRLSVPHLLRLNATFRNYWGAHTVSLFGDQISLLAIPLVAVLTLDASAADMPLLAVIAIEPLRSSAIAMRQSTRASGRSRALK